MNINKNRIMVNSITWILCLTFLSQGTGWTTQSESQYLAPRTGFQEEASLLGTEAWLVMGKLLEVIREYQSADIESLNELIKGVRFNQDGLSRVIAIPYDETAPSTSRTITFVGHGFKITFLPDTETKRGRLIHGSSIRVELTGVEKPKESPVKKPESKIFKIYLKLRQLILGPRGAKKKEDPEAERKWVFEQLDKYRFRISDTERKEIFDKLNNNRRFRGIFTYGENEELTLKIIDKLVFMATDVALTDTNRNEVLSILLGYLDDWRPVVLARLTSHLINLYKGNPLQFKEIEDLGVLPQTVSVGPKGYLAYFSSLHRAASHAISQRLDKFIIERIPQLLKDKYADEDKYKNERLSLYRLLGFIYGEVHSFSVEKLNSVFKDVEELPIDKICTLLDRLVLMSQNISDDNIRVAITKKINLFLQRRIREFLRYAPGETSADDVKRALADGVTMEDIRSAFNRLLRMSMEQKKVIPRMYRSVVRRLVSIYGTILYIDHEISIEERQERIEVQKAIQGMLRDLFKDYTPSLINEEEIQPFLDVTFDIANYKEHSLKQIVQVFSEVNTRDEILTVLRQLILVSKSRPNNVSIKRTIFAVLIARLGPGHFGHKLYYLTQGEDRAFREELKTLLLDAVVAFRDFPSGIKLKELFESIKNQVNGGIDLDRINFDELRKYYIQDTGYLEYLLDKTPEKKELMSQEKIEKRIRGIRVVSRDVLSAGSDLDKFTIWASALLGLVNSAVRKKERENLIADISFQAEREDLIRLYSVPSSVDPWEENLRRELLNILRDEKTTKLSEVLLKLTSIILNTIANELILKNGKTYDFKALLMYLIEWGKGRDIPPEDLIKLIYIELRLAKFAYLAGHEVAGTDYVDQDYYIKKIHETFRDKKLNDIKEELDNQAGDIINKFKDGQEVLVSGIPISISRDKIIIGVKTFLSELILNNLDRAKLGKLTQEETEFINLLVTAIFELNQNNLRELNKSRQRLVEKGHERTSVLTQELLKVLQGEKTVAKYPGYKYAQIILKQDYDMIIVGFGPAGAGAAIKARKLMPDAKILVVEMQPRGYRKDCAGILEERAIWGIRELLGEEKFQEFKRQHLVGVDYVRTYAPDGGHTESFSKRHVVDRGILNMWLRERAEESGIDFLDEHIVKDYTPIQKTGLRSVTIASKEKTNKGLTLDIDAKFVLLGTGYLGKDLFKEEEGIKRTQIGLGTARVQYIPVDAEFVKSHFTNKDGRIMMEIHWFTADPAQKQPTNYGWILPKREGKQWYLDIGVGGFEEAKRITPLLNKFLEEIKARFGAEEYRRYFEAAGLEHGGGGQVRYASLKELDKEGLVVIGSSGGIEHPFADDGIGISILSGIRAAEGLRQALWENSSKLEGYTDEIKRIVADQEKYGSPVQKLFLRNPRLVSYLVDYAGTNILTKTMFTKLLSSEFDPEKYSEHFQLMIILFTVHALRSPSFLWQFVMAFFRTPLIVLKLARLVNIKMVIKEFYRQFIENPLSFPEDKPLDLLQAALILMTFKPEVEDVPIDVRSHTLPNERDKKNPENALNIIITHLRKKNLVYFRKGEFVIERTKDTKDTDVVFKRRVMPRPTGMKTVLITGATGQVGSHIAYYFANKGYRVIATDRPKRVLYKFDVNIR